MAHKSRRGPHHDSNPPAGNLPQPAAVQHPQPISAISAQRLWTWGRFVGPFLITIALLVWAYTPAPSPSSLTDLVLVQNVQMQPSHRFEATAPAGPFAMITLEIWRPADAYYAHASTNGQEGRALCEISAHNIVNHVLFQFGVEIDFSFEEGVTHLWVPAAPIASGSSGWNIQVLQGQQVEFNEQNGMASIWSGANATLFNQVAAPMQNAVFTVRLSITPRGSLSARF